ncbi:(d)CMP kinase [Tessaracoccus sp. OH4464_COT-324]|uniref:(d)CMP kinase n=1 Tax=Tessaracoccus sp. OH4464_COT-324 TaxID=2491059 RepID=UPI000F643D5E|nr:(d)CMP kinase [Tessaracoccus sp. OH4464_COT-324]RRD47986.1 (d)CMP kinase [Tessaracoccus sp. OH4464_COT-324]
MDSLLIAIDGPSGSGKSTTARLLAARHGLGYLDTGAMYRAATAGFLAEQIGDEGLVDYVAGAELLIGCSVEGNRVRINGRDVTEEIREPRISAMVSRVATNLEVRRLLTQRMRQIIDAHGRRIVVEGRDITTVVAPDADVRVLLVADPDARVARREAELAGRAGRADVVDQVLRRDRDDSTVSNFTEAAEGVTVIDSTFIPPDEVVARIEELIDV